jgi:threonine/homoserine/homoserine lactone efflux protein
MRQPGGWDFSVPPEAPKAPRRRRTFWHPSGHGSADIAAAIFALVFLIVAIAPDTDPVRWWFLGIGLLILLVDAFIFVRGKRWRWVDD